MHWNRNTSMVFNVVVLIFVGECWYRWYVLSPVLLQ